MNYLVLPFIGLAILIIGFAIVMLSVDEAMINVGAVFILVGLVFALISGFASLDILSNQHDALSGFCLENGFENTTITVDGQDYCVKQVQNYTLLSKPLKMIEERTVTWGTAE